MINDDKFEFKISKSASNITLLHRDTQINIDRPLQMANKSIVGKSIGVIITNTRFQKESYNFREQGLLGSQTFQPMTCKEEIDETIQLFDCLKITDRRMFTDPLKRELTELFAELKKETISYSALGEQRVLLIVIRWIGFDVLLPHQSGHADGLEIAERHPSNAGIMQMRSKIYAKAKKTTIDIDNLRKTENEDEKKIR